MTFCLNSSDLDQWLMQQEHQMAQLAHNAEEASAFLLIAEQMSLSCCIRDGSPGLEIIAAKTTYDAQWMEQVLRQRALDFVYYDTCIPLVHHTGDWLIWHPIPTSQPAALNEAAHCLLDLVGIEQTIYN